MNSVAFCVNGHPMTPENSYVRKNGPRKYYAPQCRTCRQESWKRSSDARKRAVAEGRVGEFVCSECGRDDFMGTPGLNRHRAILHGWLPPHGTRSRYVEHGCRCEPCTEAKSSSEKTRRARLVSADNLSADRKGDGA